MGKYMVFLLFLFYGCFVQKKAEPVSWKVNVKEVALHSLTKSNGLDWVETYPSEPYYYPGSDSVLIRFLSFPHYEYFNYTCYIGDTDSVILGPMKFLAKEGMILSTELVAPEYRLKIFSPPYTHIVDLDYIHKLFGNFGGTPVREDFLNDNGSLYQSRIKDRYGEDSVLLSRYSDGSLQARRDKKKFDYYFQDGTRLSVSDTNLISYFYLTCAQYYFANGQLQRQEFYDNQTPVHNWTYYSEKGKLLKTIKKLKLDLIEHEVLIHSVPDGHEMDLTMYYLRGQELVIQDRLTDTLPKVLNERWAYVKPGTYQFLATFSYYDNTVTIENLHCPEDSPEYRSWFNDHIRTIFSDIKIHYYSKLGNHKVVSKFTITLEIGH